jgi:hypothetical protein
MTLRAMCTRPCVMVMTDPSCGAGVNHGVLVVGRGLHESIFQLNLSRFWHEIHPKFPPIPPDTF